MASLKVKDLTLKEIQVILVARFVHEMQEADEFLKAWDLSMGTTEPEPALDTDVRKLMVYHLCEIVAQRIVFEDSSPIEYEDFEPLVPKLIQALTEMTGSEENLFADNEFLAYVKMLFVTMIKTIGMNGPNPYKGYGNWIQLYLNVTDLKSVPETMVIEGDVFDTIIRMTQLRAAYVASGVHDIRLMTDVNGYIETMIRPFIVSMFEGQVMSEEEKEQIVRIAIERMTPGLVEKLEQARKVLFERLEKRAKQIYD